MSVRILHGDNRVILKTLADASVDSCVTDPPYGINTKSDGSGKLSPWGDLCNSAYWYAAWISLVRGKLRETGSLWTCLNWRSLVTFQKAACDIAWPIESLLVWDKQWIGPGGNRGLRPSYELVALFGAPDFAVKDRGIVDIQRFPVGSYKANGHPAEKPVALMDFLVKHAGGSTVADPFMGSGTTGVAAASAGRAFIGVEQDEKWFDIACRRIEEAQKQVQIFPPEPPKAEQVGMDFAAADGGAP